MEEFGGAENISYRESCPWLVGEDSEPLKARLKRGGWLPDRGHHGQLGGTT